MSYLDNLHEWVQKAGLLHNWRSKTTSTGYGKRRDFKIDDRKVVSQSSIGGRRYAKLIFGATPQVEAVEFKPNNSRTLFIHRKMRYGDKEISHAGKDATDVRFVTKRGMRKLGRKLLSN